MDAWDSWSRQWDSVMLAEASALMATADSGHDIAHVRRVLVAARNIGRIEQADPAVVLPAAWFHDCVNVPKNSPLRSQASKLAAEKAVEVLSRIGYPEEVLPKVAHAILAHSFSAGIAPETIEACVLQDADRLEAVGAIGLARCLMTGGSLGQPFVHRDEPFPITREANDSLYSVDHFFIKLLHLHKTMQTAAGRAESRKRTQFLMQFLAQLGLELNTREDELKQALQRFAIDC